VASYNTWWPERVEGESPRYTHRVVDVAMTADNANDLVGEAAGFTVTADTGTEPPATGQVSIWDVTAQRYFAFACPSSTAQTYDCTGRFESAGNHELVASYNTWWPVRLQGVSGSLAQPVRSPEETSRQHS
jgi:hypothetical protein